MVLGFGTAINVEHPSWGNEGTFINGKKLGF